jgi:hypothetical protein
MNKLKLYFPNPGMELHGNNAIKYHPFELYNPQKDRNKPAMFWLYFENDYKTLANHTGKKYICWHGTDVLIFNAKFRQYINLIRNPEITHIFLNRITQSEMFQLGIYGEVHYIFWADPLKFKPETGLTKDCYMTGKKDNGQIYGEMIFNSLAWRFPEWTFHIFGIEPTVPVYCENVKYYGWIPEDEMDEITRKFGLCLRYNAHDGFPQVVCKSLLREQYVLTQLPYDGLTVEFRTPKQLIEAFNSIDNEIDNCRTFKNEVKRMINRFDFIK